MGSKGADGVNRQLFNSMVAQYDTKVVKNSGDTIEWEGGAHCYLPSVKFYGNIVQDGTPSPDTPTAIREFSAFYLSNSGSSIIIPNLLGIGDYKDEWDYVTGKGIRRIKKRILRGTENWEKYHWGSGNGLYSYRVSLTEIPNIVNSQNYRCYCTHYKPLRGYFDLYYGQIEGAYAGGVNDNFGWIIIGNSFPTVNEFKAFLAEQYANGTPVTVYYAIAKPIHFEERHDTYTPIPNDSGKIWLGDGTISDVPFEVSYITHS